MSSGDLLATFALLVSLLVGGPAIARPLIDGDKRVEAQLRQAARLARSAERRSRLALGTPVAKGLPGDPGSPGLPGPSTGYAGGALVGAYPDPLLAIGVVGPAQLRAEAVDTDSIGPNSLAGPNFSDDGVGGGQIAEDTLHGFDMSQIDANASKLVPMGKTFEFLVGNALYLTHRCDGAFPELGFALDIENKAAGPRTVHTVALTDGMQPEVGRQVIGSLDEVRVFELPQTAISGHRRWATIYVPGPEHEVRSIYIRTRVGQPELECEIRTFRVIRSGDL